MDAEEDISPPARPKKSGILLTVCVCLVLALSIFYKLATLEIPQEVIEQKNVTEVIGYNETLPDSIDYSPFLGNLSQFIGKSMDLRGFLQRDFRGINKTGFYEISIADDFGNQLVLSGVSEEDMEFFPELGKTPDIYRVRGVFVRRFNSIEFKPSSIDSVQRVPDKVVTRENTTQMVQNVTGFVRVPKMPRVRSFALSIMEFLP